MRILLVGHGRMGRLIEQTALAAGDEIAAVVDIDNISDLEKMGKVADVVIDFSNPAALPAVAAYVRRTGTALLSGTTGCTASDMAVFTQLGQYAPVMHSANYSVGVAVFRRVLEQISDVLKPDFDIEIVETHHNQKVDAPSGTAKLLLEAIDPDHAYTPVYGRQGNCGRRSPREIGLHSVRGGSIVGEHEILFCGPDEVITLSHSAGSRRVFANGAVNAAVFLAYKGPGLYTMKDLMKELL